MLIKEPSPLQRILSYLYPITFWRGKSGSQANLALLLSGNQWQLETNNALYSDGHKYRPLRVGFGKIARQLSRVDKALFLGAGLGSGVQILDKMAYHPACTLVDVDTQVLELAKAILAKTASKTPVHFVRSDAAVFFSENLGERYGLIVIDIFEERQVPAFVHTTAFMQQCHQHLSANGIVIINYMLDPANDWDQMQRTIGTIFLKVEIISLGINRVIIARA